MKSFKQKTDFHEIWKRLRKRDFSGNTGIAIKNSVFSFLTTIVSRVGALIFTIVLARLLLPELFGLYSLALSTVMLFGAFADLGVGQTLVKFISSSKSLKKSKAYFLYLIQVKICLSLFGATMLLFLAKFISNTYYNKPIFLALVAGSLFLAISGFTSIFGGIFHSFNNFKKTFHQEILFQVSRLIIIPIFILLTINLISKEILVSVVFTLLTICYVLVLVFLYVSAKKEIPFFNLKTKKLPKKEKNKINKFIIALSAISLSGVFFGYIDMFILGRYVQAEFIGFYRAAFSLITSAAPLITFAGALFPLFSKLKGEQLKRGFGKAVRITLLVSIPFSIFLIFPFKVFKNYSFSGLAVRIAYGTEYSLSASILMLFSILIIILPLIAIYSSFLISQNKPRKVAKCLIIATILNIILNYVLILSLLPYGNLAAVYGATIATIISKVVYLGMLMVHKT
jgi:O-antigen/teichoic acid export membrane protein